MKSSVAFTMRGHEQDSSALQHAFSASKSRSGCGLTSRRRQRRLAVSFTFAGVFGFIKSLVRRASAFFVRPHYAYEHIRKTSMGADASKRTSIIHLACRCFAPRRSASSSFWALLVAHGFISPSFRCERGIGHRSDGGSVGVGYRFDRRDFTLEEAAAPVCFRY